MRESNNVSGPKVLSALVALLALAGAAAPIRTGLFVGNGPMGHSATEWIRLTHDSPELDVTFIDAVSITNGTLDRIELFVMPGGSSIREKKDFGPEGIRLFKEFLRRGGGYIGTCAGCSFLMDDATDPERGIGVIPYGRVDVLHRMIQLQFALNEKGAAAFGMKPGDYDVWYHDGPVLGPTEANFPDARFETWGTFGGDDHSGVPERMKGRPCLVGGTYGKGKVCAFSCHPEYFPFSYELVKGMFRAVTGREVTFPPRRRSVGARSVGIYYHSAAGIDSARALVALDEDPGVDVVVLDELAVSRGQLDHVDALILPNGDPKNMERYFAPFTRRMMDDFVARGGKAFAWGAGAMCIPKGGTVCRDWRETVALASAVSAREPVDFVNPLIGTDAKGHCNPGATRPFAMVQPGPDTGEGSWPYCAGYQYGDGTLMGFSQNHLCGTGQGEMGDVLLLPFCGDGVLRKSAFSHANETATPGYYAVTLDDARVRAELTSTERVAYHRYTYLGEGAKHLLVDLQHGLIGRPSWAHRMTLEGTAEFAADGLSLTGHRLVRQYWPLHRVDFHVAFSRPIVARRLLKNEIDTEKGERWVLDFDLKQGETLEVKVALSYASAEGAKRNLEAEIPGWNFDAVRADSRRAWAEILGRLEVEGAMDDQRTVLYTSLYHLCFQPNVLSDVGKPRRLSTFSFWDTYRAAHPLYTLVTPERIDEFVGSILDHARTTDFMPIWEIYGLEGYDMLGAHSIPVVLDAWRKGFKVDLKEFYPFVRRTITEDNRPTQPPVHRSNWDLYDKYGYYPCDIINRQSISKVLENTFDDWCAAEMAKELGFAEDEAFFRKRSGYWKNIFRADTGWPCPRRTDGNWLDPYRPEWPIRPKDHPDGFSTDTCEGTGYQWAFHVLHDVDGLVGTMGGREKFIEHLDFLFSHQAFWVGDPQLENIHPYREICGRIGEYAHGNEPCHHIAYLYTLAGRRDKTAALVRMICETQYPNRPDGICGNDDCGQMSAWYVFAALGFYPVNPAAAEYVLGEPIFDRVRLRLPDGRLLDVRRVKGKTGVFLNGKELHGGVIRHADIVRGGLLEFGKDDR